METAIPLVGELLFTQSVLPSALHFSVISAPSCDRPAARTLPIESKLKAMALTSPLLPSPQIRLPSVSYFTTGPPATYALPPWSSARPTPPETSPFGIRSRAIQICVPSEAYFTVTRSDKIELE